MKTIQKLNELGQQLYDIFDGFEECEIAAMLVVVLRKMELTSVPTILLWQQAKQIGANHVEIKEDENGDAHVLFHAPHKSKNEMRDEVLKHFPGLELKPEDEAAEYKEDDACDNDLTIEEIERESIRRALDRNKGNKKRAAEDLHISMRTLYRKMQKYEL